ncbi:uncharacterized protein [Epargyreus clarus]|uniref:uncharacterized protein n=1 Tax=Epargyreus clarus TaxID=520877 RepID=UPI003C2CBB86
MFYTILFCAIISVASATNRPVRPKDQQVYHLTPEKVLKVQKFTLPCIEKYNADPDIFGKLIDGTMPNDDTSKNFLYCFATSGQFVHEDGHFNIPRMSELLGDHPLKKGFEEALTGCNTVTKETPTETVYEMSLCINERAPVVFSL